MTFDEYLRDHGKTRGKAQLYAETGVSMPTLRKVENRLAVSADTAHKLADFLGCEWQLFTKPKARRKARARE